MQVRKLFKKVIYNRNNNVNNNGPGIEHNFIGIRKDNYEVFFSLNFLFKKGPTFINSTIFIYFDTHYLPISRCSKLVLIDVLNYSDDYEYESNFMANLYLNKLGGLKGALLSVKSSTNTID